MSGSVTIQGANGGSAVITLTNDQQGLSLASSFQAMTGQLVNGSTVITPTDGSFYAIADSISGGVAVVGSAATTVLAGDGTPLTFIGSATSAIVSGNGNDFVYASSGNDTIAAGGGSNSIILGSGNSTVYSSGDDSITGGTGADTVNVGAGAQTLSAGTGGFTVDVTNSSASTITDAGTGSVTVDAGSGSLSYTQLGSSGAEFIGGGGRVTISAGSAVDTMYGASGTSFVLTGSSHDNVLVANDSTHGGNGGVVVFDGSAASGGNQFWAGSGNASLIGGAGNDTLVGGQGTSALTGGGGSNAFDFFASQGGSATNVTITDFNPSDVITLFNYGSSALAAIDSSTQQGANTVLTLNDGSTITLLGFSKANLTNAEIVATPPNPTKIT